MVRREVVYSWQMNERRKLVDLNEKKPDRSVDEKETRSSQDAVRLL